MKKEVINQITTQMSDFIDIICSKDYSFAEKYLMHDVIVVGFHLKSVYRGRDQFFTHINNEYELNNSELSKQEFYPVINEKNLLVIMGRYLVTSKEHSKEMHRQEVRLTAVWMADDNGNLKISYLHLSHPDDYHEATNEFPHKVSQLTYQYVQDKINSGKKEHIIYVKDNEKQIQLVNTNEIEYGMALGHDTIIYLRDRRIHAKIAWKSFLEELDDDFIQVHRSYVVSKNMVKLIGKNYLIMKSGANVPVPVKNMKNVITTLTGQGQ